MVVGGADAVLHQQVGHFFRTASAADIDDGCPFHVTDNVEQLITLVGSLTDDISQIITLERHTEDALLGKGEPLLNVVNDGRGSRSSKCQYRHVRQVVTDVGYLKVGGTEVVAPLRDTMCLVDGDEAHLHVAQLLTEDV